MSGAPAAGKGTLIVIDDDEQIRRLIVRLIKPMGHSVLEAGSAEEAHEKLLAAAPDLVLLDMQLPGRSGHELLAEIRADPRTRLVPVVMITGVATHETKLKAIQAGVTDFIAKPFSPEELVARVRALLELKFVTDALEDAEQVIIALARTIDARDRYTYGHSARVSLYAGLLGERIGLDGRALATVRRGGLFHDFGKIAVRDAVLLKPAKLTREEYAEIQRHPQDGRDLLQTMKTLSHAMGVVYHHHERMDGSGYPDGLAGEAIPLTARVTTIADVFDALTTARVYRGALSRQEALGIMADEVRKGWWDGRLLEEFLGVLNSLPEDDIRIRSLFAGFSDA
ncbi:MAG TPA: HD domain-containing phosphohydrolase [Thermoanaerobaculia bacterium]|nr:HD domain-containing phosphohydrolase [Thermoanaerobaculia bacterium]